MATCAAKKRYGNRMAADAALALARKQWARKPKRAPEPPTRVYQCVMCFGFHLTHLPERKP